MRSPASSSARVVSVRFPLPMRRMTRSLRSSRLTRKKTTSTRITSDRASGATTGVRAASMRSSTGVSAGTNRTGRAASSAATR